MPLEHALQKRVGFQSAGQWRRPDIKTMTLSQPLGLDALPQQRSKKAKQTPIRLNVMVVGEAGLGKSTFINTLFSTDINGPNIQQREGDATVNITPITFELEEKGVKMLLTMIDSPGFGNGFDRTKDLEPVLKYIEDQYDNYYDIESGTGKRTPRDYDTRVHLCLYFIAPTGHHLKPLEVYALQMLTSKVNVIPLIAKADTLNNQERTLFKKKILQDLQTNDICVYPNSSKSDDRIASSYEAHIPFCVIGSNDTITVDGRQVRGREYSWGSVQVENPNHSDVAYLRKMLMEDLLHELGDLTHDLHYNRHRTERLLKEYQQSQNPENRRPRPDSILLCDDDYNIRVEAMKGQLRKDMSTMEEAIKQDYVEKVRLAEARLYQWEQDLIRKRQQLTEELAVESKYVDQMRLQLEQEEYYYDTQWKIKSKYHR